MENEKNEKLWFGIIVVTFFVTLGLVFFDKGAGATATAIVLFTEAYMMVNDK